MVESVLIMVAKAVAGVPTCTERLLGKTAAFNWIGKSNSSALPRLSPPTTSTWPFWSRVAVAPARAVFRPAVLLHVPVFGSYSSTLLDEEPPPATNTFPLNSSVAVPLPALVRLPVKLQTPVDGSYNSAVSKSVSSLESPAAAKTFPSGSSVAVGEYRGALRLAVMLHLPVRGSYNSASAIALYPRSIN